MKPHRNVRKSFFVTLVLTAISVGAFLMTRSTAAVSGAAAQDQKGSMVAHLKYEPAIHGYGFRNYARDHDNENDLNAGNLIAIFGAENVCETGTTASDCVLNEPAEEWLGEAIKLLAGGHCEGLAVTSLRFWEGLPFEGKWSRTASQTGGLK